MSEAQVECLNQFKQWIEQNDVTHNPWHTESFLLRFCRARKFDLDAVIKMFSAYMDYRKENGIDTIVQVSLKFISNFASRTSCFNTSKNASLTILEAIVESIKLEDQSILRDLASSIQRRCGKLQTRRHFGEVTISLMRFFRSFISWRAVRSLGSRSATLCLSLI